MITAALGSASTGGEVHSFAEGDRVRAVRRPEFPDGTVLRLMALGYLLIHWDGDVLETAHYSALAIANPGGP